MHLALLANLALLAAATPHYTIDSVAGSDLVGDGGSALAAQLAGAECVAVDAAGNVYISDSIDHRIRKVTPAGVISTIAGNGHAGFRGDGGPAREALLDRPYGLALDPAGNLYVADLGNGRVRRISPDGNILTIAGGAKARPGGGGADPLAAKLTPRNVAVRRDGALYISDFGGHRVFQVTPEGRIAPVAGTGEAGYEEEAVLAVTARLNAPAGLAFDNAGALYVADSGNGRVRKIENGRISTVMGREKGEPTVSVPTAVAVDPWGSLYVADSGEARVRKRLLTGEVVTIAAAGAIALQGGGTLEQVRDLALDAGGNLYIAARGRVFRLVANQLLLPFAGTGAFGFSGDGQPALKAHLNFPRAVAADAGGNLYIADQRNHRVRKVTATGQIGTIAGTGEQGFSGDGGFATLAKMFAPAALALDAQGGVWVADESGHRVRRIGREGFISTLAGTGSRGIGGDGGPAWAAQLSSPAGVAFDVSGVAYIADSLNHRLRRLGPDGRLTTFAGSGIRGYGGDGGPAVEAQLDTPQGVAVDPAGNVYFSDTANHCVRRVTKGGVIETMAGTGAQGAAGDGGPAVKALLNRPVGIALDAGGNLFIADTGNHRIRVVSEDGTIRTIAGTGNRGFSGDSGPALQAELDEPSGVAAGNEGALYISDFNNHRVRRLTPVPVVAPPEPPPLIEPPPLPPDPVIRPVAVRNAASGAEGPIAAGQLVTISGAGLGPEAAVAARAGSSGLLATSLAGVKVLFDGAAAPLLSVQSTRLQAQVPYRLAGRTSTLVEVFVNDVKQGEASVAVAPAAPALFTLTEGWGQSLAFNQDGSPNTATNPAAPGSVVSFYATGEGVVQPAGVDGRPAREPYPSPVLAVRVTVGGLPAEVLFAGSAPNSVGVMQVNVRLPAGYVLSGAWPVVLSAGSFQSQPGVTLSVK